MSVYQQNSTTQKFIATILWLVTAIPLAIVAVFFFATARGVEMWCGGGYVLPSHSVARKCGGEK